MKCRDCHVPMTPATDARGEVIPNVLQCPECPLTMELWDPGVGRRAPRIEEELTPFRAVDVAAEAEVVVRRIAKQKIKPIEPRFCAWKPCSVKFTPTHPHQEYHELPCQRLEKAARDKARRDTERRERAQLRAAS